MYLILFVIFMSSSVFALDSEQKIQLVDTLLECHALSTVEKINIIKNQIENKNFLHSIEGSSNRKFYLLNIINTALNYENGLKEFITVVKSFEGNSIPMQKVEELLENFSQETIENTTIYLEKFSQETIENTTIYYFLFVFAILMLFIMFFRPKPVHSNTPQTIPPTTSRLTPTQKQQLVNALLQCNSINNANDVQNIINNMATNPNVPFSPDVIRYLMNTLNIVDSMDSGLEDFMVTLDFFEGPTIPLRQVKQLMAKFI